MAKKAGDIASTGRTHSNGRDKENKYSGS